MSSSLKRKLPAQLLNKYNAENFFDEMVAANGSLRPHYARFRDLFQTLTPPEFDHKRQAVDLAFMRQGVTFNVYGDSAGTEKFSRSTCCRASFPPRNGICWSAASRSASRR